MKFTYILIFVVLITAIQAMSLTITVNRTFLDYGGNVTLTWSAGGGIPPYYYQLFNEYGIQVPMLPTITNISVKPPVGIGSYTIHATDSSYNETNASSSLIYANASLSLNLNPSLETVPPFSNLTFTNTIAGGSPPYTYNLSVSSTEPYGLDNNTVAFNGIGFFYITERVRDVYNETANAIATIDAALIPMVFTGQTGNCEIVYNMSQTQQASAMGVNVIENYITPDYARVTFNGNSITHLNFTPVQMNGYLSASAIPWIAILHTVSVEVCLGWLPNPLSVATNTTTSTYLTTTTPPIIQTTIPYIPPPVTPNPIWNALANLAGILSPSL